MKKLRQTSDFSLKLDPSLEFYSHRLCNRNSSVSEETNFHSLSNFRIGTFNMVPNFWPPLYTLQFVQQRGYRATQQITYSVIPKRESPSGKQCWFRWLNWARISNGIFSFRLFLPPAFSPAFPRIHALGTVIPQQLFPRIVTLIHCSVFEDIFSLEDSSWIISIKIFSSTNNSTIFLNQLIYRFSIYSAFIETTRHSILLFPQ